MENDIDVKRMENDVRENYGKHDIVLMVQLASETSLNYFVSVVERFENTTQIHDNINSPTHLKRPNQSYLLPPPSSSA